jgi:hypothetical protein
MLYGYLHRSSPFIGELRCQAIQMEQGPYMAERTQKAVYIVRCLWCLSHKKNHESCAFVRNVKMENNNRKHM